MILLAGLYWGLLSSDRYVSAAHIVVDRTEFHGGETMDFAALLTGNRSKPDLMLLRDHMLSVDMLEKLDARLKLC